MTRPSTDHVVVDHDFPYLECTHCTGHHNLSPRMPLELYITQLRGFLLMHRLCPKPEAPSPQMALPGTGPRSSCPSCGLHHPGMRCSDPDFVGGFISSETEKAAIDGSTDEPAPEIDPPGPYARFDEMYPIAESPGELFELLHTFLTREQWGKMPMELPWHPASGIFNAVANWARIEKVHADAGSRMPVPGLTIPRREPMPVALAELLGVKPKPKKGARPLVNPKRRQKGVAAT